MRTLNRRHASLALLLALVLAATGTAQEGAVGGELRVHVVDPDGRNLRPRRVLASMESVYDQPGTQPESFRPTEPGPTRIPFLRPGRYIVRAFVPGVGRGHCTGVRVEGGTVQEVELTVQPVPDQSVEEVAAEVFPWMDQLSLPGVAGRTFVRVRVPTTGVRIDREDPRPMTRYAFLVEDGEDRFRVTDGVRIETFGREEDPESGPSWEEADPGEVARDLLESGMERPDDLPPGLREYHQLLFLTRACREQDSAEEALAILEGLSEDHWARDLTGVRFLGTNVRVQLDEPVVLGALQACGDPEVPRVALRERFRFVAEEFPGSPYVALARDHVRILDRMIAEDASHVCPASLDDLPSEARARESIHHLGDQEGRERSSQFLSTSSSEPTSYAKLRDMGFAAVPHLLEILEDERLTRNVSRGGRHHPPRVLRYGDAAVAIISNIAADSSIRRPEDARRWWRRVEGRDPFTHHLEQFRQGEAVSRHAGRLLEIDVREGLAVLLDEGPEGEPSVRRSLVRIIGRVERPGVVPFLRSELGGPATLEAARALARRGLEGWVDPVAERLDALARAEHDGAMLSPELHRRWSHWTLLLWSGGEVGLERAVTHFSRSETRDRLRLLRRFFMISAEASSTRTPVDRLLVFALDDEEGLHLPTGARDAGVDQIRVCDRAAMILARRWETEEPFPSSGPLAERERYIARLRARWESRRDEE